MSPKQQCFSQCSRKTWPFILERVSTLYRFDRIDPFRLASWYGLPTNVVHFSHGKILCFRHSPIDQQLKAKTSRKHHPNNNLKRNLPPQTSDIESSGILLNSRDMTSTKSKPKAIRTNFLLRLTPLGIHSNPPQIVRLSLWTSCCDSDDFTVVKSFTKDH